MIEVIKVTSTSFSQCEILKKELDATDDLRECDKIQERITSLASGVGVLNVGAPTEVEMIENTLMEDDHSFSRYTALNKSYIQIS